MKPNEIREIKRQINESIGLLKAALQLLPDRPDIHPCRVPGRCEYVSAHAIERYIERTGCNKSEEVVINRIAKAVKLSSEWELKPEFKVVELCAHGTNSRFFRGGEMTYVVENSVVVTCHRGTADRWRKKA